uniref:WH2 domain-containing protein n=1 Tax=Globodera pallida TaxID=36090 RepID=A0A183C9V2_GLOPA
MDTTDAAPPPSPTPPAPALSSIESSLPPPRPEVHPTNSPAMAPEPVGENKDPLPPPLPVPAADPPAQRPATDDADALQPPLGYGKVRILARPKPYPLPATFRPPRRPFARGGTTPRIDRRPTADGRKGEKNRGNSIKGPGGTIRDISRVPLNSITFPYGPPIRPLFPRASFAYVPCNPPVPHPELRGPRGECRVMRN